MNKNFIKLSILWGAGVIAGACAMKHIYPLSALMIVIAFVIIFTWD